MLTTVRQGLAKPATLGEAGDVDEVKAEVDFQAGISTSNRSSRNSLSNISSSLGNARKSNSKCSHSSHSSLSSRSSSNSRKGISKSPVTSVSTARNWRGVTLHATTASYVWKWVTQAVHAPIGGQLVNNERGGGMWFRTLQSLQRDQRKE